MSSSNTDMAAIMPRGPKPLYPDVPWWSVLVAALAFSILGVAAGVFLKPKEGATAGFGNMGPGGLIVDTLSYTPHILLLFGVLADAFTLQGVWSIPSLVGLLSVFMNYVFVYFWKGLDEMLKKSEEARQRIVAAGEAAAAPAPAPAPAEAAKPPAGGKKQKGGALFEGYNGCTVQGLEGWNSPYAPQTLVITATVFSYYCYDLVRNRGWVNSIGALVGFITFYLAETVIISTNTAGKGCIVDGKEMSIWGQSIRAAFEGLMFGGVSYAIVQTYAPTRLPSATISPFPPKSASELAPGPDGRMYDKDGYPYVVLPNGLAVPDVSDARARMAFGEMAAESTGTTASLASNCPASAAPCAATS